MCLTDYRKYQRVQCKSATHLVSSNNLRAAQSMHVCGNSQVCILAEMRKLKDAPGPHVDSSHRHHWLDTLEAKVCHPI
jgi:hypothetical protein